MTFVVFHGAFGNPGENWLPFLKEKLESLGQKAVVPQFPVDNWEEITKNGPKNPPKHQSLSNWFETFENYFDDLENDKLCFVGHSLGCLFILHAVSKYNLKLDSAFFVSPFLTKLHKAWQIDHVNQTFYKSNFDFDKLRELIPISYVIYSDNDPYVGGDQPESFAGNLNSTPIIIKGARHINSEAGYKQFPLILELCKKRIDLHDK